MVACQRGDGREEAELVQRHRERHGQDEEGQRWPEVRHGVAEGRERDDPGHQRDGGDDRRAGPGRNASRRDHDARYPCGQRGDLDHVG